jgi:5-methylcytosine-specific restriction enzyme subunit McrC
MPARQIPIENIYYLLCYAWDSLAEADLAPVSITPEMRLQDLLASVLRGGVSRLLKRGLDRAYVAEADEIAGVRGRLEIGASLKRASFARARAFCVFDELSPDVAHNQIIKTTLRRLAGVAKLDAKLAEQLRDLYRRMPGVREVRITDQSFRRVMLSRNNAYYRFLLDVCEVVHRNVLVDEATGEVVFRDFTRDDAQMARLFERFLYNFFDKEQGRLKVQAPRFSWRATGEPEHLAHLPEMRTDIVLTGDDETIVIDAKYYAETLSEHFTKSTVRSGHLYQVFTYMSHLTGSEKNSARVSGILLYPRTTKTVLVRASLFDHPFMAATIDLAQEQGGIRRDLLALLPT